MENGADVERLEAKPLSEVPLGIFGATRRGAGTPQAIAERVLAAADVTIGGSHPWDPVVHDARVLRHGALGLGESYTEGWWDCARLDMLFDRLLGADAERAGLGFWTNLRAGVSAVLLNRQRPERARRSVSLHYDTGNDLFEAMLDRRMVYSCAYWQDAKTLDEAQEAKLDLLCRKLRLEPGHRLLDIGCGWGGLARYAAERYGARVVGITLSKEQASLASERARGLPVEIRLQDYRELAGTFDRIVSVGMIEHVGPKNYRAYMRVARRVLPPNGLFVLHTIGGNRSAMSVDRWLGKYVFPDAAIPSIRQLGAACEGLFVMEDWHNLGMDYDRTLMAWHANLESRWGVLPRYDEEFRRSWRYYLLHCAGSFRARKNQVWQIVLSPLGVRDGHSGLR